MLRRNVLIFHAGALGDFILSWPLALALGRLYPQSRIIYVTAGQKGALAEKVLRIESTDVEQGWHHLYGDASSLPEPCRRRLEGAHSIFSFISSPGDAWTKSVVQIAPEADITAIAARPPANFSAHATAFLLQNLALKPIVQTAVRQLLSSIESSGITLSRARDRDIVIHPGSGSKEKCWPVDLYIELIERLRRDDRQVRLVLGEVEMDESAWPRQAIQRLSESAEIVKCETYLQLLDELCHAKLFIGNDSGPAHLAGIIGVSTLALFGPTNPVVWKPLGPRVSVLSSNSLSTLSVDAVYDAIGKMRRA